MCTRLFSFNSKNTKALKYWTHLLPHPGTNSCIWPCTFPLILAYCDCVHLKSNIQLCLAVLTKQNILGFFKSSFFCLLLFFVRFISQDIFLIYHWSVWLVNWTLMLPGWVDQTYPLFWNKYYSSTYTCIMRVDLIIWWFILSIRILIMRI